MMMLGSLARRQPVLIWPLLPLSTALLIVGIALALF
jgi:hypothetical protein